MTGTRDPQQDGSIQAMLGDSGLETAAELRSALEQLRAVVPEQAPAPRADLAALLAGGLAAVAAAAPSVAPTVDVGGPSGLAEDAMPGAAEAEPDTAVVSLADRRRGRKRRLAIVGGAVIGAMSLGAGAVAASSEDFRHSVSRTVGVIFQPTGHPAPATEHVQPSPSDVTAVPAIPAPGATPSASGTPGVPPAGNATTSAASQGASSKGKGRPGAAPTAPPAVGRDGILPTPGQRPVVPGIPGAPGQGDGKGNGSGNGKDLPRTPGNVTPTLPGVAPTKVPGQP
jgi:hypothetical protein